MLHVAILLCKLRKGEKEKKQYRENLDNAHHSLCHERVEATAAGHNTMIASCDTAEKVVVCSVIALINTVVRQAFTME